MTVTTRGLAKQLVIACAATALIMLAASMAHARDRHHVPVDPHGNPIKRLITVPTAAGIDITVAPEFAAKIVPFIAALIAETGYEPGKIKCYSWASSHVANSLHHVGRACDFDQRGWGVTAKAMKSVAALAVRFGLRDGCEFRDWGHIDDGPHLPPNRTRGCRAGAFVTFAQMQKLEAAGAVP